MLNNDDKKSAAKLSPSLLEKIRNLKYRIFKKRISRRLKIQASIVGLVVLAIIAFLIWDFSFGGPIVSALNNKEKIINTVRSFGIFGPMVFIVVQVLQTIIAPIPGQISGGVGGFLFGWWGILWTIIGSSIGFYIVFSLSRRFGRPFVEKFVKKDMLDKFDFISGRHAPAILFLIFLLPGLPDDAVCYVAGLTEVPIKKLMALITIGRLPSVVVTNYIGAGLGEENITPVIIISLIVVFLLLIALLNKDKIIKLLKKTS